MPHPRYVEVMQSEAGRKFTRVMGLIGVIVSIAVLSFLSGRISKDFYVAENKTRSERNSESGLNSRKVTNNYNFSRFRFNESYSSHLSTGVNSSLKSTYDHKSPSHLTINNSTKGKINPMGLFLTNPHLNFYLSTTTLHYRVL